MNALLVSSIGIAAAALVKARWFDSAYQKIVRTSLLGALFVWLMIVATHIAFRRAGTDAGAVAILAVLVSTHGVPAELPLVTGVPWLVTVGIGTSFRGRSRLADALFRCAVSTRDAG